MTLRTIRRHFGHDVIRTVALAATALIVFSCQEEDALDSSNGKVTIYPVISRSIETTIQTRALPGYAEFTDNKQALTAYAIAFVNNEGANGARQTDKDKQGVFSPVTDGWRSTVEVEPSFRYNLYVYSRTMPSATAPTFSFPSESDASIEFNGLDIITEKDPLVGVASAGADLPANYTSADYPTLTKKAYSIGTIPMTEQEGYTYKAFLALDHLYAKATIYFRIDDRYSQLRSVHIKDAQIKVDHGTLTGTHRFPFSNLTLTYANNKAIGGDPISIDIYDGPNSSAAPNEGDDFIELTTSFREFGHYCFLPIEQALDMYLEVTYDICDLEGNVIRENQTAQNNNLFAAISNNGGKPVAGTNYKVNILVSPTYLYQLSDDDLELGLTVER